MADGWHRISLSEESVNPDKPGRRWELSSALGIDAFNFNVAELEPGSRLSENHFHYHETQRELFYVIDGRCQVETAEKRFEVGTDEIVSFEKGKSGAHVLHNPFEEPCKLIAVGWPPEGRYPVHQLMTTEEAVEERSNDDRTSDRSEA